MSISRDGRAPQLLIGVDAMEWQLVQKWANEGKLPTFRRLIAEGVRGELKTTAEQLPDTVWASLYTGTNPAKLEKYFYVQYDPATMGLRHLPDDAIQGKPFWESLSEAGLRVGIADAPKFPVSRSINGFQLTNWGAHATKTARTSNPPSLLRQIDSRFGHHPVGDCDKVDAEPGPLKALRQRVLDGVRAHGAVFRWLLKERPWDVFFAAFSAPHCIGHHFWHYMDSSHPHHTPDDPHGLSDSIEQVYRAIDGEIAEMLAIAGERARCLIVAGHGMGPLYHASWNLPEILDLSGYGREHPVGSAGNPGLRKAQINPWRILKMVVPGRLQYGIKAMLPEAAQDKLLFLWYAGGQRWKGCRAFAVPNNDSVGAIRISVKGRDRCGVVEPGDEYRQICDDIRSALLDLTDPATGRPIVRRVTLSHEEFRGPFLHQLPDLTVLWEQSFAWKALQSPRFGALRLRGQDARTGSHSARGFFLMSGPGIPAGVELRGHSIYDIAPTVIQAAGVPLSHHLDGRPLLT